MGTGKDITIKELAETIQKVTGHQGKLFGMLVNQMVLQENSWMFPK